MSQHSNKGRRTPLTLGQYAKSSGAGRKTSTESSGGSDKLEARSTVVIEKMTSDSHMIEQLKQKASVDLGRDNNVSQQQQQQQQQTKENNGQQQQQKNGSSKKYQSSENNGTGADGTTTTSKKEESTNKMLRRNSTITRDVDSGNKKEEHKATARKDEVVAKANEQLTAKKEEKSAKNESDGGGKSNGSSATATAKVPDSPKKNNVEVVTIRESPRQKEMRETREKEEQKEVDEALAAFRVQEEAERQRLLAAPAVIVTPATPDTKQATVDTPKNKQRSGSQTTTTVKASPVVTMEAAEVDESPMPVADPSLSLLQQSDMLGFAMEGDDMESLLMDPDVGEDSPMAKTKETGKYMKYTNSPAPAAAGASRSRISPFRRSGDLNPTNASTIVNLSTVSEQSVASNASPPAAPSMLPTSVGPSAISSSSSTSYSSAATSASGVQPSDHGYGSLRFISGRKSTRPLREVSFQHSMRESYRRIRTDLDDSISSMNATVGSEIPNDSSFTRTPVVASKGRKRLGGSEPDLHAASVDSPKKARLDFSGFFGIMASPVTLLRNKFSRTTLLCSTPNAKQLNMNAAEEEEDDEALAVEEQGGGADDTNGSADCENAVEPMDADVDEVVAAVEDHNAADSSPNEVPVAVDEIVIETEQLKSVDDIKDKIAAEEARIRGSGVEEDVITVVEAKRSRCAVM